MGVDYLEIACFQAKNAQKHNSGESTVKVDVFFFLKIFLGLVYTLESIQQTKGVTT